LTLPLRRHPAIMIITCPECLTKFRLEEERIPTERGAKARCSKCGHVFPVQRPPSPEEFPPEVGGLEKYKRFFRRHFFWRKRAALGLLFVVVFAGLIFHFAREGSGEKALEGISSWGHSLYERASLRKIFGFSKQNEGFISLEKVGGYYLENNDHNRLFVIEGEAVNHWQESRSFIKVKGVLLDPKGNKVREQEVYCGNILSEKDLREMSGEAIEKSLSSLFGISFSNVNILPNRSVPFMIVFPDLLSGEPQSKSSPGTGGNPGEANLNLSDFTVEVTGSQKGSK
jgi:predicted Zn finger-like uncharacterized protein